jgi:hypothetical protein
VAGGEDLFEGVYEWARVRGVGGLLHAGFEEVGGLQEDGGEEA